VKTVERELSFLLWRKSDCKQLIASADPGATALR
jgi:hypothetical protein